MRCRRAIRHAIVAAVILAAPSARAQVIATDQMLTTMAPCRLLDTRVNRQRFTPGQTRTFEVYGNLSAQGGNPSGCGLPGFVNGAPQVQALAINFAAITPAGPGHLRAWPSDHAMPNASILNYQALSPALNIANELPTAIRQDAPGADLSIYANQAVDVIADVVGYYSNVTAAPAATSMPATGGGLLSGRIALDGGAGCAAGALSAYAHASGVTAASEICADCGPSDMATLSPRATCVAHDLAVKVLGTEGSARSLSLVIDGQVSALGCAVDGSAATCDSGGASATIPAGSEISMRVEQAAGSGTLCAVAFGLVCN